MSIFFVRPPRGSAYGTGSGNSYDSAFNGWSNINWNAVHANDHIKVFGDHLNVGQLKKMDFPVGGVFIDGPARFERYYFSFENINGLLVNGLSFNYCGQWRSAGATNIRLKNCHFNNLLPEVEIQIQLSPGNDDWVIEDTIIENCGVGIYSRYDGTDNSADRLVVLRSTFKHIGTKQHPHQDAHAIGIQGGTGHLIFENYIEDCGEAISLWGSFNDQMTNSFIRANTIKNIHRMSNTGGHGIVISGSHNVSANKPSPGWRSGHIITGNKISGTDGNAIRTNIRDAVIIELNEIENYGRAGEYTDPIFQFNHFGAVDTTGTKKNIIR